MRKLRYSLTLHLQAVMLIKKIIMKKIFDIFLLIAIQH